MKATIVKDGETREFECDGLVLVALKGDNARCIMEGKLNPAQCALMCESLTKAKRSIMNKIAAEVDDDEEVDSLKALFELIKMFKELEDDES